MSRRILITLLAFTGALLGGVVIPLGLETSAHDRRDFTATTIAQARAIARVAEERLSDHEQSRPATDLGRFVSARDRLRVLGPDGQVLVSRGRRLPKPSTRGASPQVPGHLADDVAAQVVTLPVRSGGQSPGTVVLARSTTPLSDRIRELWLTLALVAFAAAVAAAGLAIGVSRWVTGPLTRLEQAAQRVGAGDLAARVGAVKGPVELRKLSAGFDAMTARLQALVEGHRAVIGDVSHQLRTPISALRLRLELLADHQHLDRHEVATALGELSRLSRLVEGLLAIARAEATNQPRQPIDVLAVLQERVAAWRPLALERGIELTAGPVTTDLAWFPPDHLEQVLDNLLDNCFDLEPAPAHVTLTATSREDRIVLTIEDDGPGMTAERRATAFERFITGRPSTGGTGLGLAIVHRLVTSAGGTIDLTATPGGGLTAVVTLPKATAGPSGPRRRRLPAP